MEEGERREGWREGGGGERRKGKGASFLLTERSRRLLQPHPVKHGYIYIYIYI